MKSPTDIRPTCTRSEGSRIEVLEARITPGSVALSVLSIDRQTPAGPGTDDGSVTYRVTFSQSVDDVDAADFQVVTTGNAKADPTVVVSTVSGSIYDVTVQGVQGNGDLRLDLVDDNSINVDDNSEIVLGGGALGDGSFSGEIYHVLQTMPTVSGITRVGADPTSSSSVGWTVTFSEPVDGVDAADFDIVTTGATTTSPTLSVVANNSESGFASSYTVTVTGVVGTGTVGLNLDDDETIRDTDNNPLQTDPVDFAQPTTTGTSGSFAVAIVSGYLNDDNFADLVVTNAFNNTVSVMLGNGDGTFDLGVSYNTNNNFPESVAIADFDGDGDADLAVTGSASGGAIVSVLLGNGDGSFTSGGNFGFGQNPLAVATGDLNNDGNQDIAVTHSSGGGFVNVLLGNGNGGFSSPGSFSTGSGPASIVIADLNGDGNPDVATGNRYDDNVSVLLGNGTGALGAATNLATADGMSPQAIAVGDLNGDGRPDIVVAGGAYSGPPNYTDTGKISVLLGGSSGTFAVAVNYDAGEDLGGLALSDFDGDGVLDVVVLDDIGSEGAPPEGPEQLQAPGSPVYVLLGTGTGTLGAPITFSTTSPDGTDLVVGDYDNDGKADFATANGFSNTVDGFLNAGTGDFTGEVYSIVESSVDLAVTINDVTSAAPGATVTYTFNYSNLGTAGATGVTLTVDLDSQLNFVAGENAGWTLNGSVLSRTVGNVGVSGSGSATLILHVNNTIDSGYSGFGTTVTIDGAEEESATGNNQAFDFATLTGLTRDLRVTDIEDPNLAVPGRTATFVIHYSNVGNLDISEAVIEFTIPAGTSINLGASDPGWNTGSGTASVFVDVPAGGADQTITIVLNINFPESATLATSATIDAKSLVPDGDSENDTATEETPVYNGFVVTAPGVAPKNKYAPPVVQVFDRLTGDLLYAFNAYEPNYRDSIRVATGDLNGDGVDDIVTTTQHRGGRMRFFDGATGERFSEGPLSEEVPVFGTSKNKGAFVAVGNVIGTFGIDRPEIIVGSSLISTTIGGGTVKVYSLDREFQDDGQPEGGAPESLQLVSEFKPFGAKFKGGIRVAVGDVDFFGNGGKQGEPEQGKDFPIGDIIVGQGYRGNKVRIYEGVNGDVPTTGFELLGEIQVGGRKFRGGVSVAAGDVNDDGRADIIVGRNTGKPSIVEIFDGRSIFPGSTPEQLGSAINPFDADPLRPKNTFGVRVAAADVNGDGIADIITSVGIKNQSFVKFYISNIQSGTGQVTYTLDEERTITAYSDFPNVALWVAGSGRSSSPR